MTSTDDFASSWRDLADQLAADQVKQLDELERAECTQPWLLSAARELAQDNLATLMFGHIADPPDADILFGWETDDDGVSFRKFQEGETSIAGAVFYTAGRQYSGGHCDRRIALAADHGDRLTPDDARELAVALQDAAGEIERLT